MLHHQVWHTDLPVMTFSLQVLLLISAYIVYIHTYIVRDYALLQHLILFQSDKLVADDNKFQPNTAPSLQGNVCCLSWQASPCVAKHHTFWFSGFNFSLPFGASVLAVKQLHIPLRVSPGIPRKQEIGQNFTGLIHFSEFSFPPFLPFDSSAFSSVSS